MLNPYPKSDGPYLNTQGRKALEQMNGLEGDRNSVISMFPLREVPMGGVHGGIGYVNAPLTSMEVRGFKTEMKGLLEDPIGLAEQFEQFLGPNIYTWEELDSILRSLFIRRMANDTTGWHANLGKGKSTGSSWRE